MTVGDTDRISAAARRFMSRCVVLVNASNRGRPRMVIDQRAIATGLGSPNEHGEGLVTVVGVRSFRGWGFAEEDDGLGFGIGGVHEADGEVAGGGDEGGEVERAEPCFRWIGGWVDEEALTW